MIDKDNTKKTFAPLSEREEVENKLLNKNKKINFKAKKLMDSIQNSLDDNKKKESQEGEKLLKEEKSRNTLFERSGSIISKTNDMFQHIEEMISSGNFEDVEKYSIEEDHENQSSETEEFIEEMPLNENINEEPTDFSTDVENSSFEIDDNQ